MLEEEEEAITLVLVLVVLVLEEERQELITRYPTMRLPIQEEEEVAEEMEVLVEQEDQES